MSTHSERGGIIEIVKPRIAAFEDTPLRDPRLSWKAKGIASYLLSKPPGWQIWTGDLIRRSTDGRDAVLAGLRELEVFGYLKRQRANDDSGRIQWRKSLSAEPETWWTDEKGSPPPLESLNSLTAPITASPCTDSPCTENPVMVDSPSPGFPYTAKPSTENPSHSISNCSYSDLKEEREGGETAAPSEEGMTATPSERGATASPSGKGKEPTARFGKEPASPSGKGKEPAASSGNGKESASPSGKGKEPTARFGKESASPSGKEPDGLAIIRRICDDCFIKIAPETVYGYSTVAHIAAEAARWWDETPAHLRPKNAGMLIYRIKARQFKPLTQAEIVACPPHHRWLHGDAEEPEQAKLPIQEQPQPKRPAIQSPYWVRPRDPNDPWEIWLHHLAISDGRNPSTVTQWFAECAHQWDGDTLLLTPRTDRFIQYVESRMMRELNAISSYARRPVTVRFVQPTVQAAA
jgi:hypothetical protein